ncbi:MAG: glycosyltransferase family 2 protein [Candidatus Pedobacter colombiensis]|uniref:Glycosyltransferase family 2 protein n=1 Tax=Candidatus Pedobacter colombiensis TaxID=3121371 RepID=A0AAJ5WEP5_9SPHI|nr:glycosyltransferase family 2 protein [Pedobacter sp.]WEK21222.1 MAG: glycosyltransferase family 2 protein [Pedobacter sp.]
MTFNNLVTIIIPTFNRENKLREAIESAVNQSYKNIQVIVIDDGSVDQTAKLVKEYPQIEYYYKKNGGQASARNLGLSYAKGSIIASLDSDDIWYIDFLKNCVEKLEKDQLDFVFTNWDQDTRNGETWDFLNNDPFLEPYLYKEKNNWVNLSYNEVRDLYIKSCPSPSSSLVMRRSSIVSGWNEDMNIGDDWCLYLEMILNKECRAAFTLNKLWHKRIDEINVYDGRKWSEVLEFLYIADAKAKIIKFDKLLSPRERKTLEQRYMIGLVEFAKHNLIRELNFKYSFILLFRAFAVNIPFTLKEIPKVFINGLQNRKLKKTMS